MGKEGRNVWQEGRRKNKRKKGIEEGKVGTEFGKYPIPFLFKTTKSETWIRGIFCAFCKEDFELYPKFLSLI